MAALPCARTRAHGKGAILAPLPFFAVCHVPAHSKEAKQARPWPLFAVCHGPGHTAKSHCYVYFCRVLYGRHTAKIPVPFSFVSCSWTLLYFAMTRIMRSAKYLPCAQNPAHGKGRLCRPLFTVSHLPCVLWPLPCAFGTWQKTWFP